MVLFERPPAPDEQKRMHEELLDRLVVAIRAGILSGVVDFKLGSSRDVTRAIARASTRLARELSEFALATEAGKRAPSRGKTKPAAGKGKKSGTRRARGSA